jgi:LPS export ABC transporter protein LptC
MTRTSAFCLAFYALCAPLAACGEPQSRPIAGTELTEIDSDVVQYDMRSVFTAEGVRTGYVTADSAFIYNDSSQARMFGMNVNFENERGMEQARVVADSGRLNQRTEQMDAWGSVVIELADRACRITTTEIHYDPPGRRIYTDKPVRFEQMGQVATGSGFESDLRMDNFLIRDPVGPFLQLCSLTPPVP